MQSGHSNVMLSVSELTFSRSVFFIVKPICPVCVCSRSSALAKRLNSRVSRSVRLIHPRTLAFNGVCVCNYRDYLGGVASSLSSGFAC